MTHPNKTSDNSIIKDLQPIFLVGAHKCASTSLALSLNHHPSIAVSSPKETRYYADKKVKNMYCYHDFFTIEDSTTHFLDASTHYSSGNFNDSPLQIARDWPNALILYIVRNSKDRYLSLKKQLVFSGEVQYKDHAFILDNPYFFNSFLHGIWHQIYADLFGQHRVLILQYNELILNQEITLRKIQEFLNVAPLITSLERKNISSEKTHLPLAKVVSLRKLIRSSFLYTLIPPRVTHSIRLRFSTPITCKMLDSLSILTPNELLKLKLINSINQVNCLAHHSY